MLTIKKLNLFQKMLILLFLVVGLYLLVMYSIHIYTTWGELTVDDWIEALDDKSGKARYDATLNLGRSRDPKAVKALIERLESDETPESDIYSIAKALGKLKSKQSMGPLIDHIYRYDTFTMEMIIWALGEIGDTRALPTLRAVDNEFIPKTNRGEKIKQALKEAIAKLENFE